MCTDERPCINCYIDKGPCLDRVERIECNHTTMPSRPCVECLRKEHLKATDMEFCEDCNRKVRVKPYNDRELNVCGCGQFTKPF